MTPKTRENMKVYLLDTNVYLTEVSSIYNYGKASIAIPSMVLDEIDKHKHRQDTAGLNARSTNRVLDKLRTKGSLLKGVGLGRGKGKIFVTHYSSEYLPPGLKETETDNKILACAIKLMREGNDVIVVSRDLNMRVKCDSFGLKCEDYQPNKAVKSVDKLFDGIDVIEVPEGVLQAFYDGDEIYLPEQSKKQYPNQFLILKSTTNSKNSALCRFVADDKPLKKIYKQEKIWGLMAKNKEQQFAMDLLFDDSVQIVSLTGKAGTGKTLLAAACGLEQVINSSNYDKLIITRPVQPMGRDIGFLPGSLEEKMMPWIAPLRDNLEFLFGDKMALDMHMDQGEIEIEAMTFIRGRSISNAFMIVDEAQNLTAHELKTIITRVGHGTKLILTGDIQQIDNSYVDAESNGLTHAVEKFKDYEIAGHVTLTKGERSKLASLAAEIL